MPDVVIGNVILTATLVVALLLFVAAASGLATIYNIRVRQTLLANQAEQIAQLIQQVYLIVNSSQLPDDTSYVLANLGLPNQLDGYPYAITLTTAKNKVGIVNITVTISLIGTYGSYSATAIMGKNFALNAAGGNTLKSQGTNTLSVQLYKCPAMPQNPPCTSYPNMVVLQLQGVIPIS